MLDLIEHRLDIITHRVYFILLLKTVRDGAHVLEASNVDLARLIGEQGGRVDVTMGHAGAMQRIQRT